MTRLGPITLGLSCGMLAGCGGDKPSTAPSARPPVSLSLRKLENATRVYSGDEEVPPTNFPFVGATGSVRVTMEVVTTGPSTTPRGPTVNDVLFKAEGDGRISIAFQQPTPGHHEGRVILRCESGGEESEATFEPETWLSHRSAIVTYEPVPVEPGTRVVEGREVVLGQFVGRNMPRDIRLTLRAVFSKEPVPPRVKAGPKPPR